MKSFYEFVQLLNENEQGGMIAGQNPAGLPKTGEERRRYFGIHGKGEGRTDDSVIYNDLSVDYDGNFEGHMIVWFDDDKDLITMCDDISEVINGYGDIMGRWHFDCEYTVALSDEPSKSYLPGPRGWPVGLPDSHGSGIIKIELESVEDRSEDEYHGPEEDDYNPDPDGHGYWDQYWSTGPGRDPD